MTAKSEQPNRKILFPLCPVQVIKGKEHFCILRMLFLWHIIIYFFDIAIQTRMYLKIKYFLAIMHNNNKKHFGISKCIFSVFAQTQFKFVFQSIFKRSKVYGCCFINWFLILIMILSANNYENKIIEIKLFCAKLRFTLMHSFCLVLISSRCTFAALSLSGSLHSSLSCRSAIFTVNTE